MLREILATKVLIPGGGSFGGVEVTSFVLSVGFSFTLSILLPIGSAVITIPVVITSVISLRTFVISVPIVFVPLYSKMI